MTMFAIVACPGCHNRRMIDLASYSTACPFCGKRFDTSRLDVKFKHEDQSIVRDVLQGDESVPRRGDGSDPVKKLAYLVSHSNDIRTKLEMIAEGLDDMLGEFTVDDVERLAPGKGEAYVETMLDNCLIYEAKLGRYRMCQRSGCLNRFDDEVVDGRGRAQSQYDDAQRQYDYPCCNIPLSTHGLTSECPFSCRPRS